MDSLLLVGAKDDKLRRLLDRLGYETLSDDGGESIARILSGKVIDLIVLDAELDTNGVDLLEYLRTDETAKQVPIVMINANVEHRLKVEKLGLDKIELVDSTCSVGSLAGKIATHLRLRKMQGSDSTNANLAEINAALRDLNARMHKELEEARAIQESLLPAALPHDPRFDLAVSYDPLEEVGGDWYYTRKEADGSLSMLIADVTGHGLAAAFIGSMTKLAHSAAQESAPDKLLTEMNSLMTPQLPPGRFVTVATLNYDPATGRASASRAGHPPCVLISADGRVKKLGGEGFAIGFLDDAEYTVEQAVLAPGDVLLLLTDGITEAQNRSNEMYGTDRLAAVVRRSCELSSRDIIAAALADLDAFCGGRILKDDVTLIVLKRIA